MLVVAGLGTDNRYGFATNHFGSGAYQHSAWAGFVPIGSQTFASDPAITCAGAETSSDPLLFTGGVHAFVPIGTQTFVGTPGAGHSRRLHWWVLPQLTGAASRFSTRRTHPSSRTADQVGALGTHP